MTFPSEMMLSRQLFFLLVFLMAASACAQTQQDVPDDLTETERVVSDIIQQDGIHVVRFWNPECGNSRSELQHGLYEVVEANPDVTWTFVTIWNDDESGQDVLDQYFIPESVTVLVQPDDGPSSDRANRRREFLDLPITWTPTTRIYHRNGQLAYAFNYGELRPEALQEALDNTRNDWKHD
ncbi:MAG: thioredoxin [Rubricoccaceae bacterium]|nr:thioredoxin [Rubricoccaceae bacterium]